MEPIRVLLIDMTLMLREITREVLAVQPDIAVVGELPGDVPLLAAVDDRRAEVLVIGSERPAVPDAWHALLEARPTVALLALASDGRQAVLYRPLGELPPMGLVEAVRYARAVRR